MDCRSSVAQWPNAAGASGHVISSAGRAASGCVGQHLSVSSHHASLEVPIHSSFLPPHYRSFTNERGIHLLQVVLPKLLLSHVDDPQHIPLVVEHLRQRAIFFMDADPCLGRLTALRNAMTEWKRQGRLLPTEVTKALAFARPSVSSEVPSSLSPA